MKKKLALLVLTLALLLAAFVQMQNGRAAEKQGDGNHSRAALIVVD